MGSWRSHPERPRWKASHRLALGLRVCKPTTNSTRTPARHSPRQSGLADMSGLAPRRNVTFSLKKLIIFLYERYDIWRRHTCAVLSLRTITVKTILILFLAYGVLHVIYTLLLIYYYFRTKVNIIYEGIKYYLRITKINKSFVPYRSTMCASLPSAYEGISYQYVILNKYP